MNNPKMKFEKSLFTTASKMKYFKRKLTKEGQDLYNENYKTWLKEIKDLNEQKDIPCSC